MDELHYRREFDVPVIYFPKGAGCQQGQQRSQAFSPCIHNVMPDVFHHGDVRLQLLDNEVVDLLKFIRHTGADCIYHVVSPKLAGL